MAQINRQVPAVHTHEGARAKHITVEQELRRSVLSCMLWEKEFYEDGESIAFRIEKLVAESFPPAVVSIAIAARNEMNLRHVPLLLAVGLARRGALHAELLDQIILRPDELTEFLAIYWKDGRVPIAAQAKKGLAKAFQKFGGYQLAKYNRTDKAITLRDVLFMCHAKPKDAIQADLWRQLVNGTLKAPDTWEVGLSGGADKKDTWIRLINDKRLGGLATLRNLRNMQDVGVPNEIIREAIAQADYSRVLPFRFIAAARYAPKFEDELEDAMFIGLCVRPKLEGTTLVLVDVSGSMETPLSGKSDMLCQDAASGVAMCLREISKHAIIYSFSEHTVNVPSRHGFALRDAINKSQRHWSTRLGQALRDVQREEFDRIVVITDEQSHDTVPDPPNGAVGYVINVASAQRGVGYGAWKHIDGFSEAVIDWIGEYEKV